MLTIHLKGSLMHVRVCKSAKNKYTIDSVVYFFFFKWRRFRRICVFALIRSSTRTRLLIFFLQLKCLSCSYSNGCCCRCCCCCWISTTTTKVMATLRCCVSLTIAKKCTNSIEQSWHISFDRKIVIKSANWSILLMHFMEQVNHYKRMLNPSLNNHYYYIEYRFKVRFIKNRTLS